MTEHLDPSQHLASETLHLYALPVAFIDQAFEEQLALLQLVPQLAVLLWCEDVLDGGFGHHQAAVFVKDL